MMIKRRRAEAECLYLRGIPGIIRSGDSVMEASVQRDNEEILTRISTFLCSGADAIGPDEVREVADSCGISQEEAFAALLAAYCGLDTSRAYDAHLYRTYFSRMLARLDAADYQADAYWQALAGIRAGEDGVELTEEGYAAMELFVRDDFCRDRQGRIYPQLGWFDTPFRYPALKERGREWMTVTPNEINTIRPIAEAACGRVLTFGLGLGYFAFHASQRPEVDSVTVVERSEAVIRLFERALLPRFTHGEKIRVIRGDAFDYAARVMPEENYDVVFTDLWHDVADGLPLYRRMKGLEVPGPRYFYWIEPTLKAYLHEGELA